MQEFEAWRVKDLEARNKREKASMTFAAPMLHNFYSAYSVHYSCYYCHYSY